MRLYRAWCPPRALSGLARDFCTWQAVVAVGVKVHVWRMKVLLWRPLLVRAQPRPASLERAAPDFAPEKRAVVTARALAPAPTFDAPMFDSPLQSAANSTISTATIGGKVAAAFSAAASNFFDDSALFPLLLLLPRVAARRRGAVRRRPRRLRRRSSAAAFFPRLGRAVYASPASPAARRCSSAVPRVPPRDAEKMPPVNAVFLQLR